MDGIVYRFQVEQRFRRGVDARCSQRAEHDAVDLLVVVFSIAPCPPSQHVARRSAVAVRSAAQPSEPRLPS